MSHIYLALIVYASLYPFVQWRDQGIFTWEFLSAPWPKYWTGFDVASNVLGYAPLGFLWGLSAMRMGWGRSAIVLSTCAAAAVSLLMEGIQSYLPSRVPSLADFLLNVLDGMARDKRPKRKPCNRQSTCGRCLLDNRQKISGLTGATIMRTRRCTHPTEIKTRHRPTALHKCTRQRLHNFVVHRSAKKWMRMRHHRHTKRSALGLV